MMRYIVLIIIIIALISFLDLFDKPGVNQYYQQPDRKVVSEEVEHSKEVKRNPRMPYSQSEMDFLMNAYGVGLP